uniref:Uncharacterized protein n=1 Tax=Candidozyma auris TaxID=498019 RepID=A0A0L0NWK1_CANAR
MGANYALSVNATRTASITKKKKKKKDVNLSPFLQGLRYKTREVSKISQLTKFVAA